MLRTALACAAALSLAACAPTLTRHLPSGDDPSNPDAPESAARPPSKTLERVAAAAPEQPAAPERAAAPEPRASQVVPASHVAPAAPATSYACPMHPEEVSDHPGHCSKCGMALVPRGKR